MPVSQKAKKWLVILSIPVILVVVGIVALKLIFTSERLKSMVIPRAEAATGRTVSIGEISLQVLPSLALAMEKVTISNVEGEGFSDEPFLSLETLSLDVKLLPLLQSRLEVNSLEVDRLRLLLEVNSADQTNYSYLTSGGVPPDTAAPQGPEAGEQTGSGTGLGFVVGNMLVHHGAIDYVNHKDNSSTRVRNVDLAMQVTGEGSSILIAGTITTDSLSYGSVETPLLSGLRLRVDHRLQYDTSKDQLKVERGDVTFQDMRLVLAGVVSEVTGNPVLDLTLGSDSLNIAELFSLIPGEYRQKAEGARGDGIAQVRIAITGRITDSTSADIAGTVAARGASIHYPDLPKPITDITVLSSFTQTSTKQEFRVDNLTANLGGAPVRMAMTLVNFDSPYINLSAGGSLNLATVHEYYPLEKGTELGGTVALDVRLAGAVDAPDALKANGSLTFNEVSAKTATTPTPVSRLNGTVTFSNDAAESKRLSLIIGGSDMTLAWKVKNYLSMMSSDTKGPRPTATVMLQSNHLFVRDIMSGQEVPAAGGQSEGSRTGPSAPSTSSSPPAGEGPFLLPDLDMDVNASIKTLSLEKFEFSDVRGTLRVSRGLLTMQNLSLNTFGGSVVSNGSLNLASPDRPLFDLKLNLNALEASSVLTPFTSFGQRLNGALSMSTTMKGALNDTLGLVPAALQGSGTVSVRNGTLKGVKVNQALASTLNLPDLETIQFTDWGNDFKVENGRLVIRDLSIKALNAQYVVNGSQGLDGTLEYRLTLYLPESVGSRLKVPGFAGEAVNLFKDQSGRLKFDFNVGGTTDNPKLQIETAAVQQRAEQLAKQKLEEEKKKLEKQLQDKAGDALKKLFKKN